MTLSTKIVAGGVLTFFMFGISHLIQYGQFLVPFPFVSEFTFVITVLVVSQNIQSFGWKSIPFYIYALTGSLGGRFIWEIILPLDDIIYLFDQTNFIDIVVAIQLLSLLICVLLIASWFNSKLLKFVHLLFIPLLVWIVCFNGSYLLYGWYVLYGIVCLITSMRSEEKRENGLKYSLELFTGLGLIYLMSIISIVWV